MQVSGERRTVLARVTECCAGADNARTLRVQLLHLLREVVPFDAYAWLLTDPETAVGGSPIADVPCLPRLPELIRLKYLTEVNRWTTMPGPAARLRHVTGGHRHRSRLWAEMLADLGVGDVASVVFTDAHGCWGFLDLWRLGPNAAFGPDEEEILSTFAGLVVPAIRRLQAESFRTPAQERHETGPVVLLLDPHLRVMSQTPETEAYLHAIVPTEKGQHPVPATAYNVAAQLLAIEAGVDAHPPLTRLHVADGQWVTMSAARLGTTGPLEARTIAVTLQPTRPTERLALFARAHGLTKRETELLQRLSDGSHGRELARRLGVSENTVQDHLTAIFAKTATGSRLQLVARAVGG